jgi:hypothetical protein
MPERFIVFPPLAGLCSRADAQRAGYSVEQSTAILHRLAYSAQRIALLSAVWLPSAPEWELKQAIALHGWITAQHTDWLYARIAELREPPPAMHDVPDERLELAFDEAQACPNSRDRVSVLYGVLRPALDEAIRAYLGGSQPLADQPSHLVLKRVLDDAVAIAQWGEQALALVAATGDEGRAAEHVSEWIEAAGGIDGRGSRPTRTPRRTAPERYAIDVLPRRDARFTGLYDVSTPADIAYLDQTRSAAERNAALMFKRVREMDVPEVIASIIAQRWAEARNAIRDGGREPQRNWDYYVPMFRQMWDEARHAMLGETLLEHHGVDWRRLPINVTFSYKLARYCTPVERHVLLYAIEQSLMPRTTGKPYEHRVAADAGDALSVLFHDFDWADEVLHVEIARRCLKPDLPGGLNEARERTEALWQRIAGQLESDKLPENDARPDWWKFYVRKVTGRDPAPIPETHVKDWRPTGG